LVRSRQLVLPRRDFFQKVVDILWRHQVLQLNLWRLKIRIQRNEVKIIKRYKLFSTQ
jgi:hypothetical protein